MVSLWSEIIRLINYLIILGAVVLYFSSGFSISNSTLMIGRKKLVNEKKIFGHTLF